MTNLGKRKETEAMRKLLLAGAMALAIGAGAAPAHAQWTVIDPSNLAQAVEQVRQLQQQYQTLQQQLQTAQQTYESVTHAPDNALRDLGQQFNVDQFRNALPNTQSITNMMDGQAIGAQAQQYLNRNRVYQPTGDDFNAQELNRGAQSIANNQAVATQLYQSASARITALQGLESQLQSAPDAKAVADIQARIAQEQAMIQAQQVQAQSLGMMQQAQERNERQRSVEQRRRGIENAIEAAKQHGG
ncbi:VirB family protein (plasmid) [Roseomonas mucosa]|uniref:type IV secretion system protein n=1 Tax=Roseomonas mucosa TaxID=207340 RepID=UPI0022463C4C|nr:type IV secretion system protein [Roseomonas mucosa]UZO95028.1 VirB family protein [Roseomonas mucosa]